MKTKQNYFRKPEKFYMGYDFLMAIPCNYYLKHVCTGMTYNAITINMYLSHHTVEERYRRRV